MATLAGPDKEYVIGILNDQAVGSPVNPYQFFKNVIQQADLPKPVLSNRIGALTGAPEFDSRNLVEWALNYGVNPQTRVPALGAFIQSAMKLTGLDDQLKLAAIAASNRLLPDGQLTELRSQYQIPLGEDDTAVAVLPAARGPAFAWHGEQDELQLQGLFPPQPQLLDVGLIVQAAKRALAICRVEVGTGLKGTGVLIGANLVLTNYHVMAGDLAAPRTTLAENAPSTVLRFGAFTNTGVSPQDGQTVKLAAENPIVDADPQLDFALLRTSNQIAAAKDIVPYAELGPLPARADALYVLQHPEGGPMKLALSSNGVTWVDVQYGIIQYVTRVNFGSSGSPCFDDKWKLIALHHAGNQKKGEGILMQSIFAKIQPYLPK